MIEIIVKQSGQQPVTFNGALLAEGGTKTDEAKRWYTLKVYEVMPKNAPPPKFVAAVEYGSTWQHEPARYDVYVADTTDALVAKLLDHDPLAHVVGYPRGKQFEEKQVALRVELRRRWDNLVTEVLAQVPGAAQKL